MIINGKQYRSSKFEKFGAKVYLRDATEDTDFRSLTPQSIKLLQNKPVSHVKLRRMNRQDDPLIESFWVHGLNCEDMNLAVWLFVKDFRGK